MRKPPLVSFGLPVRDGSATIRESIESVLAQTFEDWELVISDNFSTDGTSAICAEYAALDERIRHVPSKRDLAQNENFCEAFRLSRGTYFRWHGDDDWLEPEYTQTAVHALEQDVRLVLCASLIQYHEGETAWNVVDFVSEMGGVCGHDPVRRMRRLFALLEVGDLRGIDPVYSLIRSSELRKTGLIGPYRFGDFILSCELALRGEWVHVAALLAHRRIAPPHANRSQLRRFTNKGGWTNVMQREVSLAEVWQRSLHVLTPRERARLLPLLVRFYAAERTHGAKRRFATLLNGGRSNRLTT